MEQTNYYQLLHKFSVFNTYFAFLDTEDYLADGLFIKHQVRVYFGDEFVNPDIPYRIIFCHVRKWDKERFCAAMRELPNKMILCGNVDYLNACVNIWGRMLKTKQEGRASDGANCAAEQMQQKSTERIPRQAARLLVWAQSDHAHCVQREGV